jgi:hypothetical protein
MTQNMVNKPDIGDLETPVSNLLCAITVGAQYAEQVLHAAGTGRPFSRDEVNCAVWALYQIMSAAESLDADFTAAITSHYASTRAR